MSAPAEFGMHDGRGGLAGLPELLALVPDNDWAWSTLDVDGIGNFPGPGVEEFRDEVLASPSVS